MGSPIRDAIAGHEEVLRPGWEALWALDSAGRQELLRFTRELRAAKSQGSREGQEAAVLGVHNSLTTSDINAVAALNVLDHLAHLFGHSPETAEDACEALAGFGFVATRGPERRFVASFLESLE